MRNWNSDDVGDWLVVVICCAALVAVSLGLWGIA
jgi:hypothetical protein